MEEGEEVVEELEVLGRKPLQDPETRGNYRVRSDRKHCILWYTIHYKA
jgi:hypothetical protein